MSGKRTREKQALSPEDTLYARLSIFQHRVSVAEERIREAIKKAGQPAGASISGGKDSTVLYDMVKRLVPGAHFAFFDSGGELPQTEAWIDRHPGIIRISTQHNFFDMLRWGGYWGYRGPELRDLKLEFDFDEILVREPARKLVEICNLQLVFIGLREAESRGRRLNYKVRGWLYYVETAHVWHCTPLIDWTDNDVWAYIASRQLDYNEAYDAMAQAGIPRQDWRVSIVLGTVSATRGRMARLKLIAPDLWNRLAAEFPKIRSYT